MSKIYTPYIERREPNPWSDKLPVPDGQNLTEERTMRLYFLGHLCRAWLVRFCGSSAALRKKLKQYNVPVPFRPLCNARHPDTARARRTRRRRPRRRT